MKFYLGLPLKWFHNIIYIQEKKEYNFYVILLFALFVGIVRFTLELLFTYPSVRFLNLAILGSVTFYLHCIFIYTLILYLFIPGLEWKRSIHLILIGVFLGVFPPVIDVLIYGPGNFEYDYVTNYKVDWRLGIFNKDANVPLGEALTVFFTMFLVSAVVRTKTKSWARAVLSFLLTYLAVFFYGGVLPLLADTLSNNMMQQVFMANTNTLGFRPVENIKLLSFLQIGVCVCIYLFLNKELAKGLLKRVNHVIPVVLTTLFGYSVFKPIDSYAVLAALIMLLASLVTLVQNDYFDREADKRFGRDNSVTQEDVAFFNVALVLSLTFFVIQGFFFAVPVILFLIVSYLYNYDYYRGKKYFPSNYKIEGVAGLSAFLTGASMNMISGYDLGASVVNSLSPLGEEVSVSARFSEMWSVDKLWIAFFVFGGWSIFSVIKDYKDIESDKESKIQTAYTLLSSFGKDVNKFHRYYCFVLALTLLIPVYWLGEIGASSWQIFVAVFISVVLFGFSWRRDKNSIVRDSIILMNLYILNLLIASHLSFYNA